MRIGILTLPFNNNYGGYLQAYALQTVLERKGHEVVIINRQHPKETKWKMVKRFVKTMIHLEPFHLDINSRKGALMHKFVDSRMHLSSPLYSSSALHNYCVSNSMDYYIAGSDQLWRPCYVPNVEDYFFDYLPDAVERIAYAASFGVANPIYTDSQRERCGEAIQKFTSVGLRENSGKNVINSLGWKANNVNVVLDPTMLLEREHYESLLGNYVPSKNYKGSIVTYILDLDKSTKNIVKHSQHIISNPCIDIIDRKKWKSPNYVMPPIEEWLCAFRDADFVITDSFHGTVFSIIFHKPFVVKVNKNRGSDRFDTLLGHFGIEDRAITDESKIDAIISQEIDWVKVDNILAEKRNQSLKFLNINS